MRGSKSTTTHIIKPKKLKYLSEEGIRFTSIEESIDWWVHHLGTTFPEYENLPPRQCKSYNISKKTKIYFCNIDFVTL